jgi:signal peptidase I
MKVVIRLVLGLALLALVIPVLVCDRFVVRGESMLPTFSSGEAVWVNKLCMGARIYTDYDFVTPKLSCFRIPGLRKLRTGDVAVFNYPFGRGRKKIEFRINYVCIKRCLGCPGDTICIRNGICYNQSEKDPIGNLERQSRLRDLPDTLISEDLMAVYPYSNNFNWTIKDIGPLVVPRKGMNIKLDAKSSMLYASIIEYENGRKPFWEGTQCRIGDVVCREYTFKEDYYYFVGDNVLNSKDSRYFGFVPEDYIVGRVSY